jgi:hypothetical protein
MKSFALKLAAEEPSNICLFNTLKGMEMIKMQRSRNVLSGSSYAVLTLAREIQKASVSSRPQSNEAQRLNVLLKKLCVLQSRTRGSGYAPQLCQPLRGRQIKDLDGHELDLHNVAAQTMPT